MNLQTFNNEQFGKVRVINQESEPWFVAKDVADILGYQNGSRDVNRHTDEYDRKKIMVHDGRQNKETILINESGLYSLILGSKLPQAKEFKRWVTSDVLPSIRKNGMYATEELLSNPEFAIATFERLRQEMEARKKAEALVVAQQPKVLFADAVSASHTSILIGDLAKILKQNGQDMGQKRLFNWMRENGYLIKRKGADYNMPTQKAMDKKLFEIKETTITHSDGHISISKTTKVTGEGQQYFINKFLGGAETITNEKGPHCHEVLEMKRGTSTITMSNGSVVIDAPSVTISSSAQRS